MAEKEQVKPLAPAANSYGLFRSSDFDINSDIENKNRLAARRRKSYIKCCGCASAILVIAAVTLIILAFTLFHVRGPIVRLNSLSATGDLTAAASSGDNVTLIADVSVKNPNAASFRYRETLTTVFYGGAAVGSGRSPAGVARARRTVRANVTVEVSPSAILAEPRLAGDLAAGALSMESFTRIEGRVKIANVVKKKVVVELNCTMTYHILTKQIQRQNCKQDVNI